MKDLRRDIGRMVHHEGTTKTSEMLTRMLKDKHIRPDDISLAHLCESYMGREYMDSLNPTSGRTPTFHTPTTDHLSGQRAPLLEADTSSVSYANFAGITGQIFFTEINRGYELEEAVFDSIIESKSTNIFDMEKIPNITMPGDEFSVVGDTEDYPFFGVGQNYQHRAALEVRGGIIPVSKLAIKGDKTGMLLEQCKTLGKFLKINKEKRLIDAVIDSNTGAKSAVNGGHRYFWLDASYASYQTATPWINVAANNGLIDFTSINNAWVIQRAILDPFTGEPIDLKMRHLIVTPTNYFTAIRIKRTLEVRIHSGGYATSGNLVDTKSTDPVKEVVGDLRIVSSERLAQRLTTGSGLQTTWWLGDLTEAIRYAEMWKVTTEEAPSYTEAAFKRDIIFQHKASEAGRAWWKDPRQLLESTA